MESRSSDTSPLHRSERRSLSFFTLGKKISCMIIEVSPLVSQRGSRIKIYLQVQRLHFESRSSNTSLSTDLRDSLSLSLSFFAHTRSEQTHQIKVCANINGGGQQRTLSEDSPRRLAASSAARSRLRSVTPSSSHAPSHPPPAAEAAAASHTPP